MSIKPFICIILSLVLHWSVLAQKDTIFQTIREEVGTYTAPVIETSVDLIFRTKVPSRWMFKLGTTRFFNFGSNLAPFNFRDSARTPIMLGAEYKLSPAFSIGTYYAMTWGLQPKSAFVEHERIVFTSAIVLEGRWYHDMKKRMREGRSANNFGGKYLSLQANLLSSVSAVLSWPWEGRRIALRYGWQHRSNKSCYFDLNGGIGFFDIVNTPGQAPVFSTDQRFSLGLATFLPKIESEVPKDAMCDVTRCHDDQYKMLKINFFRVIDFGISSDLYHIRLNPGVAFEQKIGRSPLSVEVDMTFNYSNSKFYDNGTQGFLPLTQRASANVDVGGELHWYLGMHKRVVKGISGNNLSGIFMGLRLHRSDWIKNAYTFSTEDPLAGEERVLLDGGFWAANFVMGIQRRLLDRGYFQFKLSPGVTFGGHNYLYRGADNPLTKTNRKSMFNGTGAFNIGFFF